MTTWLTADQHFGHTNILRHCGRPFRDVGCMNESLVSLHNELVRPNDIVYHLGDFVWKKENRLDNFLSRLNGTHYLVPGNHDACHSLHSKCRSELARYFRCGFDVLPERFSVRLPHIGPVMLCHFPLRPIPDPKDRYPEHRPDTLLPGCPILLCGHIHEKWIRRGPCINVGVDVWKFRPVSTEELAEFVRKSNGKDR